MGIESDGTVKGCPTLPTAEYAGGNVRDLSIERIWAESAHHPLRAGPHGDRRALGLLQDLLLRRRLPGRLRLDDDRHPRPPREHAVVLPPGDRAEKRGIRERLEPVEGAPQLPYDHGRFVIVEEPWPEETPHPAGTPAP